MKYSYSKDIKLKFEDAENNVREALTDVGFGILTQINITKCKYIMILFIKTYLRYW